MLSSVVAFFQNPETVCLVLAHPDILLLKKVEEKILTGYQLACLHTGKELSSVLLTTPQSQRSHMARQWLETTLREKSTEPVLCSDIDLLFQPSFDFDPVMLFRQISRHTRLIVLWPGTYDNGVLAYATPEHQHYRTWRQPQAAVIDLRGVSDALS
ncbi:MAG: BREX-3 system P-loop-containing protein BrxF [Anaerolineales bacterium]|nr:BREX-3 system P-loop-containing protein BrxF [Anaerolineales bacterium]